jgi:lipid-A-disaccharide synthase
MVYKMMETPEHKELGLIGLPNLIMGREVVPEVIQENLTAANVLKALEPILADPEKNTAIRNDLAKVKQIIGPPDVMIRAAKMILEFMETKG